MARNRSLDDFIDTQSGSDAPDPDPDADAEPGSIDAGAAEADADSSTDPEPDPSPAAAAGLETGPATTTMAWDPDGAACEACGSVVERRWRDDDALVCIDCKEW